MKRIAAAVEQSTDPDVIAHFPEFVRRPQNEDVTRARRLWFDILRFPAQAFVWLALRPRNGKTGTLDPSEVDAVYNREAANYDWKHHLTTRGQDLHWRRLAGWLVASAPEPRPTVLDLCTGTGLTVVEMARVLRENGRQADITALDYNEAMLNRARARMHISPADFAEQNIKFVRGDATALVENSSSIFVSFAIKSFDIVTQIFGIGGISDPLAVCQSVLRVLRENGRFLLIDMHRPVAALSGEYPVFGRWIKMPSFEAYTFKHTALPLVLARLWGWRDTTLDFYLASLTCEQECDAYYGLQLVLKCVESERWWLSMPVMPTCRALFEKVRIDRAEYDRRQYILAQVKA